MREAFESEADNTDKDRLLITMAIPASFPPNGLEKGFDVESLNKDVDFFNLMAYDYHSEKGKTTKPVTYTIRTFFSKQKGLHKQLPSNVIPAFFALMNKFFSVFLLY